MNTDIKLKLDPKQPTAPVPTVTAPPTLRERAYAIAKDKGALTDNGLIKPEIVYHMAERIAELEAEVKRLDDEVKQLRKKHIDYRV